MAPVCSSLSLRSLSHFNICSRYFFFIFHVSQGFSRHGGMALYYPIKAGFLCGTPGPRREQKAPLPKLCPWEEFKWKAKQPFLGTLGWGSSRFRGHKALTPPSQQPWTSASFSECQSLPLWSKNAQSLRIFLRITWKKAREVSSSRLTHGKTHKCILGLIWSSCISVFNVVYHLGHLCKILPTTTSNYTWICVHFVWVLLWNGDKINQEEPDVYFLITRNRFSDKKLGENELLT
jgi:hypothetical protein